MSDLPEALDFARDPRASPDRMNLAMAALDARLRALEVPARTADDELDRLRATGLTRINDALQPTYARLADLIDKYSALLGARTIDGGTFAAPSTRIETRRSTTAGEAPVDLLAGELALNAADGILFWPDAQRAIQAARLLAAPAPLESPRLTGAPTAPTPEPGDNTRKLATTAFVASALAAALTGLVGGAPSGLDTLKGLADAVAARLRVDAPQALTADQRAQAVANLGLTAAAQPGQIAFFPRWTAPPGWLKANGASLPTAAYPDLYAVLGTLFGGGGGTFALPDLRGLFLRGWDDGRGMDTWGGRPLGSFQYDQLRWHGHNASASTNIWPDRGQVVAWVEPGNGNIYHAAGQSAVGVGLHASTSVSIGGTGGDETNPKNLALLACVKY